MVIFITHNKLINVLSPLVANNLQEIDNLYLSH